MPRVAAVDGLIRFAHTVARGMRHRAINVADKFASLQKVGSVTIVEMADERWVLFG